MKLRFWLNERKTLHLVVTGVLGAILFSAFTASAAGDLLDEMDRQRRLIKSDPKFKRSVFSSSDTAVAERFLKRKGKSIYTIPRESLSLGKSNDGALLAKVGKKIDPEGGIVAIHYRVYNDPWSKARQYQQLVEDLKDDIDLAKAQGLDVTDLRQQLTEARHKAADAKAMARRSKKGTVFTEVKKTIIGVDKKGPNTAADFKDRVMAKLSELNKDYSVKVIEIQGVDSKSAQDFKNFSMKAMDAENKQAMREVVEEVQIDKKDSAPDRYSSRSGKPQQGPKAVQARSKARMGLKGGNLFSAVLSAAALGYGYIQSESIQEIDEVAQRTYGTSQ